MTQIFRNYFSSPLIDNKTFSRLNVITINSVKDTDAVLSSELQEALILSYADKGTYDLQFENATEQDIIDYINHKIPGADNQLDKNVARGDFGEVFCQLVSEYFYGRTCFNKLKYKFNNKKSVFGTDVLAFDDINNPKEIRYYEVKTRKELTKEYPKKGESAIYISIIAHNSLYKDYTESFNSVLDFMFQRLAEEKEYDKARVFRDINNNKTQIKKEFEIFILTEDNSQNKDNILKALNDLPPRFPALSVTIVVIKDLYAFIDKTWSTITNKAVYMFGDNDGQK